MIGAACLTSLSPISQASCQGSLSRSLSIPNTIRRHPDTSEQPVTASLVFLLIYRCFPCLACPMACMPLIALGEMRVTLAPDQAVGSDTLFCSCASRTTLPAY
jgi:hypothetical protein